MLYMRNVLTVPAVDGKKSWMALSIQVYMYIYIHTELTSHMCVCI